MKITSYLTQLDIYSLDNYLVLQPMHFSIMCIFCFICTTCFIAKEKLKKKNKVKVNINILLSVKTLFMTYQLIIMFFYCCYT